MARLTKKRKFFNFLLLFSIVGGFGTGLLFYNKVIVSNDEIFEDFEKQKFNTMPDTYWRENFNDWKKAKIERKYK